MKKQINYIIVVILLSFSIQLFSQENKPYQTKVVNGVEYYVYTVQPREGLYRISKNFNVSQDEIIQANPEIKSGVKLGQVLLIPTKKAHPKTAADATHSSQPATSESSTPPVDIIAAAFGQPATYTPGANHSEPQTAATDPHFYYHKVEKQQTLYSLSKKYGVDQKDIIKYNPDAARGIRKGEVLRIPKPEDIYADKKQKKLQEDISVKYLIHEIEPKETFYSISKKYNVKVADIRKINPGVEMLTIGQELKIPYYTGLMTTDTINGKATTYIDWDKILQPRDTAKITTPVRIAFLLPFVLENKQDPNVPRFVEFYAGALKAIYETKDEDISIELYTYDTGKTLESIQNVFAKNPGLKNMDLIIGPAYSSQVSAATLFAKQNKIKTLIPFTSKVPNIETNPYVFQFNAVNSEIEYDFMKKAFASKWDKMNYIFADIAHVPTTDDGLIISQHVKQILDSQNKKHTSVTLSDPFVNPFDSVIVYGQKNMVIFNTERFQYIEPYLESLNRTDQQHDVVILERYGWKGHEVYRPVGVYVAPFKMERDMKQLEQYDTNFVTLFGWESSSHHPRYDIWGYDLTRFFINMLSDKNLNIETLLELKPYTDGIQSQFHFKRNSTNEGFINYQLYIGESQIK